MSKLNCYVPMNSVTGVDPGFDMSDLHQLN